jgi:hypothetical protein
MFKPIPAAPVIGVPIRPATSRTNPERERKYTFDIPLPYGDYTS